MLLSDGCGTTSPGFAQQSKLSSEVEVKLILIRMPFLQVLNSMLQIRGASLPPAKRSQMELREWRSNLFKHVAYGCHANCPGSIFGGVCDVSYVSAKL